MSVSSFLTLCLTVSGSYVKCACHKNTFHIGPLVKTLALMNHDLSENETVYTEQLYSKDCGQFFQNWQVIQYGTGKSFLCSLSGQLSIVLALRQTQCVADRTTRSDALSDAQHQQHRGERSPWVARSRLDTGSFSSEWAAGCEDSHKEALISFSSKSFSVLLQLLFCMPLCSMLTISTVILLLLI